MFFECFRGKLFENRKRYTKSKTTVQKALEERIPNHILHGQFERKISIGQSNLLYPLYGVYVYNYLKRQKMPKRVKMFTSKWHRKQQQFFIHPFRSLQCIRFVEKKFLARTSLPEPILYGEGVNFNYAPFCPPPTPGILTGPNWHMHNFFLKYFYFPDNLLSGARVGALGSPLYISMPF